MERARCFNNASFVPVDISYCILTNYCLSFISFDFIIKVCQYAIKFIVLMVDVNIIRTNRLNANVRLARSNIQSTNRSAEIMDLHIRKLVYFSGSSRERLMFMLDHNVYSSTMLVHNKKISNHDTWGRAITVRMLYVHSMDIVDRNREIIRVYVRRKIVV